MVNLILPFVVATSMLLPPVATILAWLDIVRRRDLSGPLRGFWVVTSLLPALGPLLYLGIGQGHLLTLRTR